MGLEMRAECERCHAALPGEALAFLCSYECTFCPSCTVGLGGRDLGRAGLIASV